MVAGVDGDLTDHQDAILGAFRRISEAFKELSRRVDHLSHEITPGRNLRPTAARPDGDAKPEADGQATGEMRKAQAVREDFMERALEAQKAGRIDGRQVAEAEACINSGQPVPVEILQAVVGGNASNKLEAVL
jgi:hypothetical protein